MVSLVQITFVSERIDSYEKPEDHTATYIFIAHQLDKKYKIGGGEYTIREVVEQNNYNDSDFFELIEKYKLKEGVWLTEGRIIEKITKFSYMCHRD